MPASWPMAGKGASARSLLVKPALSEASAGLARALTVNPRRGVWSSVADMVVAGGPACVRGRCGDRWRWIRSMPKGGCHVRVGENSRVRNLITFSGFCDYDPLLSRVQKRKGAAHERRLPTRRLPSVSVARGTSNASLLRASTTCCHVRLFAFVKVCPLSTSDGGARHEATVGRRDPRRGQSRGGDPRAGRQRRGLESGARVVAVARRSRDDGGAHRRRDDWNAHGGGRAGHDARAARCAGCPARRRRARRLRRASRRGRARGRARGPGRSRARDASREERTARARSDDDGASATATGVPTSAGRTTGTAVWRAR